MLTPPPAQEAPAVIKAQHSLVTTAIGSVCFFVAALSSLVGFDKFRLVHLSVVVTVALTVCRDPFVVYIAQCPSLTRGCSVARSPQSHVVAFSISLVVALALVRARARTHKYCSTASLGAPSDHHGLSAGTVTWSERLL